MSVCDCVIYFFVQFSPLYSLFLFNLVPIFVKINQFSPYQIYQIDTKFNIFYTNYINIFSKIDIFINYFLNSIKFLYLIAK